ncbi:hypothetical protein TNCT_579831 [Trichonephila clavata]|uniref:Uncharacterized protein n=1 Tax=Trichonephila clavata TaxID=2740835 RepID=A0A8X6GMY0_TRICU|nr:hypothetical protein TNCT_579831 [Trichonephila clavata]
MFGTGCEQSPSFLEVKLQLNNISALRDKIECLRKDYYSLPADVDLTEADSELEQLDDRLDKIETVKSRVYGTISNKNESFNAELEYLVIPKVTDLTPSVALNISDIQLPQGIQLADPEFFKPGGAAVALRRWEFVTLSHLWIRRCRRIQNSSHKSKNKCPEKD